MSFFSLKPVQARVDAQNQRTSQPGPYGVGTDRPAAGSASEGCPPDCAGPLLPGQGRPRSFLGRSAGSFLGLFPGPASRCDPTRTPCSGRDREAQMSTTKTTGSTASTTAGQDKLAALHEQIS